MFILLCCFSFFLSLWVKKKFSTHQRFKFRSLQSIAVLISSRFPWFVIFSVSAIDKLWMPNEMETYTRNDLYTSASLSVLRAKKYPNREKINERTLWWSVCVWRWVSVFIASFFNLIVLKWCAAVVIVVSFFRRRRCCLYFFG